VLLHIAWMRILGHMEKPQRESNEGGGVRFSYYKREAGSLTSLPGGDGDCISSDSFELSWLS